MRDVAIIGGCERYFRRITQIGLDIVIAVFPDPVEKTGNELAHLVIVVAIRDIFPLYVASSTAGHEHRKT